MSHLNNFSQYFIKFSLTSSNIIMQFATMYFCKSMLVVFLWAFVTYWIDSIDNIVEIFVSNVWIR